MKKPKSQLVQVTRTPKIVANLPLSNVRGGNQNSGANPLYSQ